MGRLWRRWELHTACGGETDQIECRKKVVREWLVSFESESFHAQREFVRRSSNRERIDGNLEVEAPKMV
jgi:hypothetical protein